MRQTSLRPGALWLTLPGLLYLLVFLLLPCIWLLSLSVEDADTGAFTLAAYARAFGVGVYTRVLTTTFVIALETTLLCLLLGYPVAYWLTRQPKRRQRLLALFVLFPFWTSALVKNFVWLVLLGRMGAVVTFLKFLGMAQPPELLFNRGAVVFGMTHTMLPLAIITMLPVMNQIDPRLPLAAATMGASRVQAFWRVFFQLSVPGVAAAGLLVFIGSLGFFITPALLGGPRETMLGQIVIQQILGQQNWQFAGALATMLVASALITCMAYDRLFGLSSMSGGLAGQGSSDRLFRRLALALLAFVATLFDAVADGAAWLMRGRRFGWLLPLYAVTLIAVLLLPIIAFVPMAFTSSNFLSFPPPGYSLRWFAEYFGSAVWVTATIRSFGIGLASGCLTLLISAPAAYGVARSPSRLSGAVFILFLAPIVVPSIVTAVALFYLFAQMGLVATNLGITIGHTVSGIPLAFVILLATLRGYDWRLNQAAATLGADRGRTLTRITVPLLKGGLFAAFIFGFLHSFEELTVALFIGGGLKTTLPRQMWDDISLQVSPTLAAASVVILLIVTSLFLIAEYLRPQE
ncbi:MAG TPA: ABC transporter permease subunit [Acetobacteraceae bacterium]|nr:ABC transporter permease subunit [Acetobacteraceae bacterium]